MASETISKVQSELDPTARPALGQRAGRMLVRIVLGLSGLGLLIGFFLPWIVLGQLATLSGFSLMVTGGDAVEALSGAHRFILFVVPLFGAVLLASAVFADRFAAWLAAISGMAVLGSGLVILISLFFSTTGLGMWLVAGSALVALLVGFFSIGRSQRARATRS